MAFISHNIHISSDLCDLMNPSYYLIKCKFGSNIGRKLAACEKPDIKRIFI